MPVWNYDDAEVMNGWIQERQHARGQGREVVRTLVQFEGLQGMGIIRL